MSAGSRNQLVESDVKGKDSGTGGLVKRAAILMVVLFAVFAGCTDGSSAPSSAPSSTTTSLTSLSTSTTAAPADEHCVDETLDQPPEEAVVGADLAAWVIEPQLPPPLRTGGLQGDATTIFLDGEPVGEVSTEEVEDGIFLATGYSYCVPADLDLSSIDVAAVLGGDWRLIDSTPDLGPPADAEVGLTLDDDWAGGRLVCNEYGGFVAAGPEGAWRVSQLSKTEMDCGTANQTESDYTDRLGAVNSWLLRGSDLQLDGPKGMLTYTAD